MTPQNVTRITGVFQAEKCCKVLRFPVHSQNTNLQALAARFDTGISKLTFLQEFSRRSASSPQLVQAKWVMAVILEDIISDLGCIVDDLKFEL